MGMYGGGGSTGAGDARRAEASRQSAIDAGMAQINAAFEGGNYGINPASFFDADSLSSYYTPTGVRFDQLTFNDPGLQEWIRTLNKGKNVEALAKGKKGGTGDQQGIDNLKLHQKVAAALGGNWETFAIAAGGTDPVHQMSWPQLLKKYGQSLASAGQLYTGVGSGTGFGEDFYQNRENQYLKYATPIFADQLHETRNSLAANLARRGLLKSSARVQSDASLDKYAARKEGELASAAVASGNELRRDVAEQKSALTNQLLASGDPSLVSTNLTAATRSLRQPGAIQPLGNLFSDWTNVWRSNQEARAYDPTVQPLWSFGGGDSSRIVKGN